MYGLINKHSSVSKDITALCNISTCESITLAMVCTEIVSSNKQWQFWLQNGEKRLKAQNKSLYLQI